MQVSHKWSAHIQYPSTTDGACGVTHTYENHANNILYKFKRCIVRVIWSRERYKPMYATIRYLNGKIPTTPFYLRIHKKYFLAVTQLLNEAIHDILFYLITIIMNCALFPRLSSTYPCGNRC